MENCLTFPQKVELSYYIIQQLHSLLGIYSRALKTYVYTKLFIALFGVAKKWRQPKCSSASKWVNKMWYIHTTGYYSATKKEWNINTYCDMNEFKKQVKEARYKRPHIVWFHSYEMSRRGKSTGTESSWVVTRGQGKRRIGANCWWGTWLPFGVMERSGN